MLCVLAPCGYVCMTANFAATVQDATFGRFYHGLPFVGTMAMADNDEDSKCVSLIRLLAIR